MRAIIACLAAAALAASAGLGCQTQGPPKAAEGAPLAAPSPQPAAAPAPPAPPGTAAQVSREYAADIEKLCDVVRRSGADTASGDDRLLPIANWLAANLTTAESRRFLVQIQPLAGDRKADALEAEARRVGLPGCNLAAEWRSPPAP